MTASHLIAEVLATVTRGLRESMNLPGENIGPETNLATLVGWDSVAAVGFLIFLEEVYGQQFDPLSLFQRENASAIADFVINEL